MDELSLFSLVNGQRADGGARAGIAASISDLASEEAAEARFNVTPCAHVLRFLLAPDELFRVWKRPDYLAQRPFPQSIKLFDPNNGTIGDFGRRPLVDEVL